MVLFFSQNHNNFHVLASMITGHTAIFLLFVLFNIQSNAEIAGIHDLSKSLQWLPEDHVSQVCVVENHSLTSRAFAGNAKNLVLIVTNKLVESIAGSKEYAWKWVQDNIVDSFQTERIFGIVMGEELFTGETTPLPRLIPAMESMHAALSVAMLNHSIKVSTVIPSSLFTTSIFINEISTTVEILQDLLGFLSRTSSYLIFRAYIPEKPYKNVVILNETLTRSVELWAGSCSYPFLSGLVTASLLISSAALLEIPHIGATAFCKTLVPENRQDASLNNHQAWINGPLCIFPMQEDSDLHPMISHRRKSKETSRSDYCAPEGCTWCVASQEASSRALKAALDYACGEGGADCKAIAHGGLCYHPNTLRDHASYVFNIYYQKNPHAPHACDFNGAATIVKYDPSYGHCIYTSGHCISNDGPRIQIPTIRGIIMFLLPAAGWLLFLI